MIKLLAVDDDHHLLETIVIQIEEEGGYEIKGAASLEEARVMLPEMDPDLVILDVMLPGLSGFEIIKRMKNIKIDTPIIFLSAKDDQYDIYWKNKLVRIISK